MDSALLLKQKLRLLPFPVLRIRQLLRATYARYQRHRLYQCGLIELRLLLRVLHVDNVEKFERIDGRIAERKFRKLSKIQSQIS